MIAFIVTFAHLLVDIVFGAALLNFAARKRGVAETVVISALLGMYLETLAVASLMFLRVSLNISILITLAAMAVVVVASFMRRRPQLEPVVLPRPLWFEWALLAAIAEKVSFAVWQLTRTPTYYDDALTHWSGRARSLFGGANWSFDPASPLFFAGHLGNSGYPLLTVIWRVLSAKMNGEWNEIVSRADGLIFFFAILATIWLAVFRISNSRAIAAGATFVSCAIPLHAWHAAAGYSDIAVEAFVVAAIAALLREEWLLAGVMAAGAVWSKNDTLFLYIPSLLLVVAIVQWRNLGRFMLGFATISPWLVFNYVHGLGFTSGQGEIVWHSDAPRLLWDAVMMSPSSSVLWIGIFLSLIYTTPAMLRDRTGRALLLGFLASLGAIVFTFSASSAYRFLVNQMTIHRVLMQFSGMTILIVIWGLSLRSQART